MLMVYLIKCLLMFCSKRRLTPHVYNSIPKGVIEFERSEFYTPSAISDFSRVPVSPPHGECESFTYTTDIVMLFNQKRLDRMTRESLIQHFESLAERSPKFASLRSKLSDDQLCSIVKSRYIQSPSELMAYSNYLVTAYGEELASMAPHVNPAGDPASAGDPAPAPAE